MFGYPSAPPYHGRSLDYCDGPLSPDPYGSADEGLDCTLTEGDSGGPWFSGFDPRTGRGVITGVTTFRYSGAARTTLTLYSADLGPVAAGVVRAGAARLRGSAQLCGRSAEIWRARAKSAAVRPPAEWVLSVSVTLFQLIATSG